MDDVYQSYERIIFYKNEQTYPKRVSHCLSQIDDDYIMFIHDIDILLSFDENLLNFFYDLLYYHNLDRIDLKHSESLNNGPIYELDRLNYKTLYEKPISKIKNGDLYLIKQQNIHDYIYNVNPSIWKKSVFEDILNKFDYKNYRTIEEIDVQSYTSKYNIFKIGCSEKLLCGYFNCIEDFKFLHISHSGKFLPLNDSFTTVYNQPYSDVSKDYVNIVKKYNLIKSDKWFK